MNFIEMFLDYTQDGESPTSFFRWAALGAISAVMRDNVYVDLGMDRVYPNIYILFVANSGGCRKGMPLKKARKLIEKIGNTKFIAGRASIQGVLAALATTETNENGKLTLSGASGVLYSEELSAFIVDDPAAIKILTDWYDYHEKWDNTLVGTGVTNLKKVCICLFGASNEALLRDVYTEKALYGGLLARTFLVVEKKRRKKNSLMYTQSRDDTELVKHLRTLSRFRGNIAMTDDAKAHYHEWYNSFDDEHFESKTGFVERVHTGVLKVAACLAACEPFTAETTQLLLTKEHVIQSIEWCWSLKQNYEQISMKTGKSPIVNHIAFFLKELGTAENTGYQLARSEIIKRLFSEIDADTLENVINTLEGGGLIKTTSVYGEVGYQLTPKCLMEVMNIKPKAPVIN